VGPVQFPYKARPIRYAKLVLFHARVGHVVHSGASGAQNMIALFFMLGWDQYGFDKKCVRIRFTELAFLHPVGSTGHKVHSDASGVRHVD
jgi:hypothetical protein